MSKKSGAKGKKGAEGFHTCYQCLYGSRWDPLQEAMACQTLPVTFQVGSCPPYYLDRASVDAALQLEVKPGEVVLDMCAAPGGKSVVLASCLQGEGHLVSNDRSAGRRARLKRVIQEHLPPDFSAIVEVTAHDASRWGLYQQNIYDRILLDAPCSSERHLLSSPGYLAQWSPSRTKRLAAQAFAMAAAALDALKPGGIMIYSTCTISPVENDEVIEKLLKRRKELAELLPINLAYGEKTAFGHLVLPDHAEGKGPMYMAKIRKRLP